MKYDRDTIIKLVSELNNSILLLEDLSKMEEAKFLKDPHMISSAKYNFILCIEAIIDIANHLISKNDYRVPEDYADSFNVLEEHSIINSDYSATLKKMARFRNRLVHVYWEVDSTKIYEIINNNLDDIRKFKRVLETLK